MLSKEQAIELAAELSAQGVEAIAKYTDFAPKNPDGSYVGTVEKIWHVAATLRDPNGANTVVRRLSEVCDAGKVTAEMQRELKARVKEMRARIRAERAAAKS